MSDEVAEMTAANGISQTVKFSQVALLTSAPAISQAVDDPGDIGWQGWQA